MKGKFIVIDGIGGCGKSTIAAILAKRLGKRAVLTHEPGGAPRAEKIREILLRGYKGSSPLSDFFLFWAARAEHISEKILPALAKNKIVVSDRFDSATFAFQIAGEKHPELSKLFWQTRESVLKNATPDLYIILDLPVEMAAKRRASRKSTKDRFDEKDAAFQNRARAGFLDFAQKAGANVCIVHATGSVEDVSEAVWSAVSKKLA